MVTGTTDDKKKRGEILGIIGAVVLAVLIISGIPVGLKYLREVDPQASKADELIKEARAGNWESL